jgi:hypothetical protein
MSEDPFRNFWQRNIQMRQCNLLEDKTLIWSSLFFLEALNLGYKLIGASEKFAN